MERTLAVCIATYHRTESLARLLESLVRVERPAGFVVEVRVVDNDPSGSASASVASIRWPEWCTARFAVEPRQGIAHARNCALELGEVDLVAFVDDDETVPPHWLRSLVDCQASTDADVVLGPVTGVLPESCPPWFASGGFFDKEVGETGRKLDWRGGRTSNTLVRGEWFASRGLRFDDSYGRSGGSDSELFWRLYHDGGTLVACDEARVLEDIEPERAQASWLLKRSYRNGLVFQRIAQERFAPQRAAWRFVKAAGLALIGLPGALANKPARLVRAGQMGALAWGGLSSWIKPTIARGWVEYTEKSAQGSLASEV